MTFFRFLKSIVKAPVLAVACTIFGILLAALLLLANSLIHLIGGFEHGQISQIVHAVAKHVPLVFGVVGFLAAFMTDAPIASVFGSARWATGKELQKLSTTDEGLLIGRDPTTDKLLRYNGPAHLLTMAPTRTGKGVGTIIPNLLTADRSVICVDPKGENARVTGRAREQFGPVHILDPFGVTGKRSSAFNPLEMLDADGLDIAEDANTLADALVFDEPGMTGDAHWNDEAKALIAGLILKIAVAESPGRRTLATLREYLTLAPERFLGLLARMQDVDEANGLIARAANRHIGKSDREAAGVLSAAQRHTHFLDSPRMTAVLGRSDFRFADLKRNNATVFLVLPPDRLSTYSRWLRLLITQSLTDMARDPVSPTRPVLYLLDEFAALGHLAPIERAMGLMAGYGVQLWPILQDTHQLRATYGGRAGTFLSNAAVLQVFGVNDIETAELIARSIGKTDAQYITRSWSEGKNSSSEHISARDLINADEIMRLPEDRMILLRQGQRPAWVQKLRYYADPEFKGAFDPA
ncbi:type IV secretory system conjugative DNA transfer family protein [Ensifer sp. ENS11]|uniref:type IV secretory system conjugative DNA transfer family protein n=1 Tax=Ensifer sp. ENS11 TaxID=2769291 RepID=UPI0017819021|nr:type IV secretory system conjugative DNA transfer family protein [Ensifer sp. ENS11]MBD9490452.1 type IV secretory system conjugative DNA transfer family protein [Ensifer sp. ENS11]MDP9632974.1 type IV secretion system protein VirD4 [Ensifer adhaerens]